MPKTTCQLYLERTDPGRNMARFYRLSLETDLFEEVCVVRSWGRIGKTGRTKIEAFADEISALRQLLKLAGSKRSRGYHTINDGKQDFPR